MQPERTSRLSPAKRMVLEHRLGRGDGLPAAPGITRATSREALPLSFAQQRLWFLAQLDPGSAAYHVPFALRLAGPLDVRAFGRALRALVERHEGLRTAFPAVEGRARQQIGPAVIVLPVVDLRALPRRTSDAVVRQRAALDAKRPFDLGTGPLVRLQLLRVADREHVLLATLHHIVTDAWSLGVLARDLGLLYAAAAENRPPSLDPLEIQYADYAVWQRGGLQGPTLTAHLAYWRPQLEHVPPLDLPADHPRPPVAGGPAGQHLFVVEATVAARAQALARSENVTLFMVLLTAFEVLLYRYTEQPAFIVGTPVAGRTRRETEPLIGLFVNMLPLRADVGSRLRIRELLARVRETCLGAYAHQDLPFERLVEEFNPERDQSRNPLFQVAFTVENAHRASLSIAGLAVEQVSVATPAAKFDLVLTIGGTGPSLHGGISYALDLFDPVTIQRMHRHYAQVLSAVTSSPDQCVGDVPLLTTAEREELLGGWSGLGQPARPASCLQELFERQVARVPDAIALVCERAAVSYAALNRRSNRVARELRALGVGSETTVAVRVERSLDLVVGILGVLKAGGAYVPLDPQYPSERLAYVLADAHATALVTTSALRGTEGSHGCAAVCLDVLHAGPADDENAEGHAAPDHLAYVIYTSGSTGHPKGVMVTHAAVSRLLEATEAYGFGPGDRWTLFHSAAFDFSVWEMWGALACGGRLVVVPHAVSRSPSEFHALLRDEQITILNQTPSAFKNLLPPLLESDGRLNLRAVIFGGEALVPTAFAGWFTRQGDGPPLINMYGITETTVHVTRHDLQQTDAAHAASPIGRPIPGWTVFVLDGEQQPVAAGVAGQLYVGGAGVARGYLGRPALTASRFLPDPFDVTPGARLYRTGDRVRWRKDGVLEYLGRLDHQVKVRGHRIELGEIEAVLARCPGVTQAVVVLREEPNDRRLVAYVVGTATPSAVRAFVERQVPAYMVPAACVAIDRMPLTRNGKVDRQALPAPTWRSETAYAAPRARTEIVLSEILRDVLGAERVGLDDNFFALGADSILTIQVVARARAAGIAVTPRQLFDRQTVRTLAEVAGDVFAPVRPEPPVEGADVPLTPIQRACLEEWSAPAHFNQAVLLRVDPETTSGWLAAAVRAVVDEHASLRMRFIRDEHGEWHQIATPGTQQCVYRRCDLTALPRWARRGALEADAARVQGSLDPASATLVRAAEYALGGDDGRRLLLVIHHLAVDGVSWRILLEDLGEACERCRSGAPARAAGRSTPVGAWIARLRAHSDTIQAEAAYWVPPPGSIAHLPRDFPDAATPTVGTTRTVTVTLGPDETRQLLHDVPPVYHTRIEDVLLTALAQACGAWSASSSVWVELEGHGREDLFPDVDLSRTVGWFTTLYPVRLDASPDEGPGRALRQTKEGLRRVPQHGIGYAVLRYLSADPDIRARLAAVPPPEIVFNYLGQFDQTFRRSGLFEPAPESAGPTMASTAPCRHLLDVSGLVVQGRLHLSWRYSTAVHRPETIQRLADDYLRRLRSIVAHCLQPDAGGWTPSDFPLAGLTQAELDAVVGRDADVEDVYPLSPLQQGLWLHSLEAPHAGAYVTRLACELRGLDVDTFRRAWEQVVARHPVLRTTLVWDRVREPLQVVRRSPIVPWTEEDWRGLDEASQREQWRDWLSADLASGFHLSGGPLLRLAVVHLDGSRVYFAWTMHHVLCDGWSRQILVREVFRIYEALRTHTAVNLPRPAAYRDHIAWVRRLDPGGAEAFWREELRGFTVPTPLVAEATTWHQGSSPAGAETLLTLEAQETARLEETVRRQQVTLNTVVQAAFAWLLSRYSGQLDVVFGATVAGRSAPLDGLAGMVGLFINTLPVRVRIDSTETVGGFVQRLQARQAAARQHEQTPLADVQRWSDVPRGTALFHQLLVFENYPVDRALLREAGAAWQVRDVQSADFTHYPLVVTASPGPQLSFLCTYQTTVLDRGRAEALVAHLGRVVTAFAIDPAQRLMDVSLLSDAERDAVLRMGRGLPIPPPPGVVAERIAARAAERPAAVAVADADGRETTYGTLMREAEAVAARLRARGVGAGDLVAVLMEPGARTLAALLGIWQSGAAYVPLDPAQPAQRLASMLDDAQPAIVLSDAEWSGLLPASAPVVVLSAMPGTAVTAGAGTWTMGPTAYVLYTSGSTGRPKGVAVSQQALSHYVAWAAERYAGASAWHTSLAFDLTVTAIWVPLVRGETVVVYRGEPAGMLERIVREGRTPLVKLTPSHLGLLPEGALTGSLVRQLVVGGEALATAVAARAAGQRDASVDIENEYGPTEATVGCVVHRYDRDRDRDVEVPIGRPSPHVAIYVLDETQQLVPPQVEGELHIGGPQLADGYWRTPGQTASAFVPSPFGPPGARVYRSGDRGRWRADGTLEYRGRRDAQVKIRGHRVELGDIRNALLQDPAVRDAAVLVREDPGRPARLIACVAGEGLDPQALRRSLRDTLPDWMVPSSVVAVAELPLTPNGKLDDRALAVMAPCVPGAVPSPPVSPVERTVAAVWSEVLQCADIDVEANFFDLGGDSLLLARVHVALQRDMNREIPLVTLFRYTTIRSLAEFLGSAAGDHARTDPGSRSDALRAGGRRLRRLSRREAAAEVSHGHERA